MTCRDEGERSRLLDMSRRLRATEAAISALLVAAGLVAAAHFGWSIMAPVLPPLAVFWLLQGRLPRFSRPELWLFCCNLAVSAGIAGAFVLARAPRLYLLAVMVIPTLLLCMVFPPRAAVVGIVLAAALLVGVALGFDLTGVEANPFGLVYPLEALICAGGVALVVASLELATRDSAIVDPLTGLPNRLALRARVAELEHQARTSGRPVGLLVGDPDNFKGINDSRGHAVGDRVLREIGNRIRRVTGAQASAYRLGGEEFVVLIGDATRQQAAELAERIRAAVAARAIEGMAVRISFGVAVSDKREPFQFSKLFGKADRALYEAKRGGGNTVRIWPLAGREDPAKARREEAMEALAEQFERRSAPPVPEESFERWQRAQREQSGSWLVQDEVERRQLLELNKRLRERAKPAFAFGFIVGLASAWEFGWQIMILPCLMTVAYILTEHRLEKLRRPELALGGAWLGLQGSFGVSALIASKPMIVAGPLLFLLLVGSSAVFPPRGVAIGVLYTVLLMAATAAARAEHLLVTAPGILCLYVAITAAIGGIGVAVGRSTIDYRGLGIIDQLTGLFNRQALNARVAELGHRPGLALSVVLLDVDRFKRVNDTYGHARGDAVLRELGYRLRKRLRAFESVYRFGGEEFIALLEGVGPEDALGVARRLRQALAEAPIAGLRITASFGVAGGAAAEFDSLYAAADQALYAAKRRGGDAICLWQPDGEPLLVEAPPMPPSAPEAQAPVPEQAG